MAVRLITTTTVIIIIIQLSSSPPPHFIFAMHKQHSHKRPYISIHIIDFVFLDFRTD
jgi:hypothetical protein